MRQTPFPGRIASRRRRALLATPALAQDAPKIDGADTAFMIVATALVLMMTLPGLALFYSGMVRKKNVLATMAQSLIATAVVSLLWIARRLQPDLLRRRRLYRRHGARDAHGRRDRHGEPARQDDPRNPVHGLSDDLRGHHLRAGRRLGRRAHEILGLHPLLRASGCSSSMCLRRIGSGAAASCRRWACSISPAARSCISTPASRAWSARWCMGNRVGFGRENLSPFDLSLAVIGTGLLWVGWFGFNGGSALGANSRAVFAIVATHLAACSGALVWSGLEWFERGKPSVLGRRLRRRRGARHDHAGLGLRPALARRRHRPDRRRRLLLVLHRGEAQIPLRRHARRLRRPWRRRHHGHAAGRRLRDARDHRFRRAIPASRACWKATRISSSCRRSASASRSSGASIGTLITLKIVSLFTDAARHWRRRARGSGHRAAWRGAASVKYVGATIRPSRCSCGGRAFLFVGRSPGAGRGTCRSGDLSQKPRRFCD